MLIKANKSWYTRVISDKVTAMYIVIADALTLNLTEESAESEPAWKGIGQKPGLQIWRIVVSIISYSQKGIGQ